MKGECESEERGREGRVREGLEQKERKGKGRDL